MALVGAGMLCTRMDVEPVNEAELNRWFDKEHMEERASIPGFLTTRRYTALAGSPKYLNLYDAESVDALSGPAYQKALRNQTDWSQKVMAQFRNFLRTVGRITVSVGMGHGSVVGLVWVHPVAGREDDLRAWFEKKGFAHLMEIDDLVSAHVLESDPALSGPPPGVESSADAPSTDDWFAIVEGTNPVAVSVACQERFAAAVFEGLGSATHASFGVYTLRCAYSMHNGMG